jgi:hypothetical protein
MAIGKDAPREQLDQLLASHTVAVRHQVERLRRLIRQIASTAAERVYPGWHAIGYTDPTVGYFCAIFPQAERVRLAFEFGVLLADPAGLLSGGGRQVRYVDLSPGEPPPEEALQSLIKAALSLPPSRAARLQLIQESNWGTQAE